MPMTSQIKQEKGLDNMLLVQDPHLHEAELQRATAIINERLAVLAADEALLHDWLQFMETTWAKFQGSQVVSAIGETIDCGSFANIALVDCFPQWQKQRNRRQAA
jgi:hypothetical protein